MAILIVVIGVVAIGLEVKLFKLIQELEKEIKEAENDCKSTCNEN